jgi:predicted Zn-dependent protease
MTMNTPYRTDALVDLPPLAHRDGCRCLLHARRRLGGALLGAGALAAAGPVAAQSVDVSTECKVSGFTKVVSADQIEQAAGQQYAQMLSQASGKRALAPPGEPQLQRLRYIANRIVPYTTSCNPRARHWKWDVNLIGSDQLNAFCMPGGKIAFFHGILAKLQLSDDEVAMIMGHEIAHALLEHARERMGKTMATRGAIEIGAAIFGIQGLGRTAADIGGQLLTLSFSRSDESEADALGLVVAAAAGYDPRAGVSLWQKMLQASKGAPPQWLSTHPSGESRIAEIQARLPRTSPVFERAGKPGQRFSPPSRS